MSDGSVSARTISQQPRAIIVSTIGFVSGAAGLIFEVVWFHRAGLVLGNSLGATSIVLSSFMGGLALGNALVARYPGRHRHSLQAYAVLEAIVAASGIAVTYTLPRLVWLLVPFTRAADGHPGLVNLIRLVTAFAVLLVPATAMGATLPLLVGALSRQRARLGAAFGRLYGWNTLGAVAGVMVAELVLVGRIGVAGSAWLATGLDLAAAAAAFAVVRLERRVTPDHRPAMPDAGSPYDGPTSLFACAFLSGGILLALEVVWFRCLTMYVLTTTMATSVMLAVVLACIGLGGLAGSTWLARHVRSPSAVPLLALAAGASVPLSYLAFQSLTAGAQIGAWPRILWFACVLTAPTAFLSGCVLTLLADAVSGERVDETRAAAALTLANTAGAMCGAPLAAFVLLPSLGMEGAFVALALAYGVTAFLALRPSGFGVARAPAFAVALLAFGGAIAVVPAGLTHNAFARAAQAYASDGSDIVATSEGPAETIFVMQQKWLGKPVYSRLVTNGFSMSGTTVPAMRYMRYFAYWPMVLHQGPLRRALVICYGVGVTVGAVADIPSLESLDVVEISRDVVAASDVIYPPGARPLQDPRIRLHLDDGRFFLQTTAERFDLITGEPPPPRTPGAVNIYTREYFQLIHDRLADGGITTYWLPVARPDPGTDVNTIMRSFCDVFDDCSLWNGTPSDLMLVGTRHATGPLTAAAIAAPWQRPALAARLREVGFERPEQIGATFIGDAGYLGLLTAGTPPLTDDFPLRLRPVAARPSLSDPAYRSDPAVMALFQDVIDPARARRAFAASAFIRRLWPSALVNDTLPFFDTQRIVNRALWEGGAPLRQIEDLHAVLTGTTLETLPLWLLGSDDVKQRIAEQSEERSGATEYARGLRALAARQYLRAAAHFGEAERRGLHAATLRPLQVYALCLAGDRDTAGLLAREVTPQSSDETHFWSWLHATFGVSARQ